MVIFHSYVSLPEGIFVFPHFDAFRREMGEMEGSTTLTRGFESVHGDGLVQIGAILKEWKI